MTLEKDEILSKLRGKKLVVAVSGGVDSVVLLDVLSSHKDLIVAHADHGMREDSEWTAKFVENLATQKGLKIKVKKLNLDDQASENEAREARYGFLEEIKNEEGADYIVTAHHRDDVIETMVFNILRGTGRRGLASLKSRDHLARPLLNYSKGELYDYAVANNLEWLEDESNRNTKYSRNQIRLKTLPALRANNPGIDEKLFEIYKNQASINEAVDELLGPLSETYIKKGKLSREAYSELDPSLRKEMILHYLRDQQVEMKNIGRADVLRIDDFIVGAKPAKKFLPTKQVEFSTTKNEVKIATNTVVG